MALARKSSDCLGPHLRMPWSENPALMVMSHAMWSDVRSGRKNTCLAEKYRLAKKCYDVNAAADVIEALWNEDVINTLFEQISSYLMRGIRIIVVYPTPKFQEEDCSETVGRNITNALPFMLATRLSQLLNAETSGEIIQTARPGRTTLKGHARFLYQPRFEGAVETKAVYILVDDAYSRGGTLAALRSHIVSNGGTVGAVCVLTNKDGKPWRFPISDQQVHEISKLYGREINNFIQEQVGHDICDLTESEGSFLIEWPESLPRNNKIPLLQRLREKFDSIRSTGE